MNEKSWFIYCILPPRLLDAGGTWVSWASEVRSARVWCAFKDKAHSKDELQGPFSKGVEYLSLTTNKWTSQPGDSCESLTCHVLDTDFVPCSGVLQCKHVPVGHSDENVRELLEDLIREWDVPHDVSIYIITDMHPGCQKGNRWVYWSLLKWDKLLNINNGVDKPEFPYMTY